MHFSLHFPAGYLFFTVLFSSLYLSIIESSTVMYFLLIHFKEPVQPEFMLSIKFVLWYVYLLQNYLNVKMHQLLCQTQETEKAFKMNQLMNHNCAASICDTRKQNWYIYKNSSHILFLQTLRQSTDENYLHDGCKEMLNFRTVCGGRFLLQNNNSSSEKTLIKMTLKKKFLLLKSLTWHKH